MGLLMSDRQITRSWWAAGLGLAAIAIAMRVHNAFGYFLHYGFDALFNWDYVAILIETWVLPDPEIGWSTARPPLFFHLGGLLARAFGPAPENAVPFIRLLSSAIGLGAIGVCVQYARQQSGGDAKRAVLAGALIAFVPAHIYMSAMLNEEILVASLTTFALFLHLRATQADTVESRTRRIYLDMASGVVAGLAFLTKLTGSLVIATIGASRILRGLRERNWKRALASALLVGVVAGCVGGWFYVRSLVKYGYLYPSDLEAHHLMFSMPPGERTLRDYVYVPLSTFTNPRLDDPDLLHSVWGGTYATLWSDGQRHFTPNNDATVDWMGSLVLVLALLPTVAFFVGIRRGVGRAIRDPRAPDVPMLMLIVFTFVGYAAYTWATPWFATIKGSYLLGLALPYSHYTSEVLCEWTNAKRPFWQYASAWLILFALLVGVIASFTFGTPLWEMTGGNPLPGVGWEGAPRPEGYPGK